MTLRLNTNLASLNAQRRLGEVTSSLGRTYERLASGLRIQRASDDAAGLAVATSLNVDTRLANQAIRNINDAISLLNIGSGALEALSSITIRISELSEQAANGVLSNTQRRALDEEALALQREYNRITATAEFNGRRIFDPDNESVEIQNIITGADGLEITLGSELMREEFAGSFGGATTSDLSGYRTIESKDLNKDGKLDLLSWNVGSNRIGVSFGNGDGTFQPLITYSALSNAATAGVVDLNNDGNLDVIGTNTSTFQISLGNSNGSFRAQYGVSYGGGNSGNRISFGDIDSDGNQDVFVFSGTSLSLRLFLGNGDGTFRPQATFSSMFSQANSVVNVSDFNNDGRNDLYVSFPGQSPASFVALQNNDGTFRISQNLPFPEVVFRIFDVNDDGLEDIVSNGVTVKFGNSDGTFKSGISYTGYGSAQRDVKFLDLNNDREEDLVSVTSAGLLGVGLGNSDGSFRFSYSQNLGLSSVAFNSIEDVNNDGVIDLIYGFFSGETQVYLANTNSVATLEAPDLRTREKALATLEKMKVARERITAEMGNIGVLMSRLDTSRSTLQVLGENLSSAASQILDADVATESAELVRKQILQQAAQAVLAQANQLPQLVLRLIQGGG